MYALFTDGSMLTFFSYKPRRKNVQKRRKILCIDYDHSQDCRLQKTMRSSVLTSCVSVDLHTVGLN
jgi:hypothetical protein